MRRFTAEYLEATRTGMWADSREALSPLALEDCESVLDVGAGTGALTRVLREETDGTVIAVDADRSLLSEVAGPAVLGDATDLPFVDDAVDLVVCQALLVNLPDPLAAIREFRRVARDRVAAIEPDNGDVRIESTVPAEETLARRAREAYLAGVETDATLGAARESFERAGLADVEVRRYEHERTIERPYSQRALEAARRKADGRGIAVDRDTILAGPTSLEEYDDLRADWREMGREVIDQMRAGDYRQREVVPFYVTVGRV